MFRSSFCKLPLTLKKGTVMLRVFVMRVWSYKEGKKTGITISSNVDCWITVGFDYSDTLLCQSHLTISLNY